jgi:pimeloyl-ACP methyl ester carboxylesterase
MKTVELSDNLIAYRESGQGRPLLLLHANPGDHRDFEAIVPALAERYRVIAVDWPGYGQSPAPQPPQSASAFLYAELLQAFIQALQLEDVLLMGNSVGGFAAVQTALAMPDKVAGLVLVSPGGFTPHNAVTRLFCRIQGSEWVTRVSVVGFAKLYLRGKTAVTQAILHRAATEHRQPDAVAVNAAIWRSFTDPAHDLRQRAAEVLCPTLVVSGKYDLVIPANKDGKIAADTIPQARQVILATGHEPFAENPQAFLTAVLPFLHQLEPTHEPAI